MLIIAAVLLALVGIAQLTIRPGVAGEKFSLEQLADGLEVVWGIDFLSDTTLIFTEKTGSISTLDLVTHKIRKLYQVPEVYSTGQGGLLDVAVPADFGTSKEIFFTYSKRLNSHGVTVLAKSRLQDGALGHWQDILITDSLSDTSRHFGSRITFDQAGHIFFTIGDRGERPTAQDLSNHAGAVLRVNRDGTIPEDNPYYQSSSDSNALPEIYSYGHRNPQGIAFDAATGRLWLIEHGPRGGDEINLVKAGRNYGWPVVSHGQEYYAPIPVGEATEKPGMEPPVKVYIPSIAPGSLLVYSGKAFPDWQGNLFAGALKLRHINRITVNSKGRAVSEERLLETLNERIRDIAEAPDGLIYFSTDSGKIFRIKPSS